MTAPLRGKRRKRIAAEVAERFIRERASVHDLAQELGHRPVVIRNLLTEAGISVADVPCIGVSDTEAAATLARRYSAGASITELVRLTGMDKRVVRALLVQADVELPERHSTTSEDAQQIVDGYRAGASIRTLASLTGCSYGTVRAILLSRQVRLRRRGAAEPVARSVARPAASGRLVCAHSPAGEPTDADKARIAAFAEFLRSAPRLAVPALG